MVGFFTFNCSWSGAMIVRGDSVSICCEQAANVHSLQAISARRPPLRVAWVSPLDGCNNVNTDGSHSSGGGSTCGGLIRRSNGSFVRGITCKLGAGNALWVDLWGVCLGMRLARQLGLSWVIFEADSKVVTNMINSRHLSLPYLDPLLKEISSFLDDCTWRVTTMHSFHQENRCADYLGRSGLLASSFDFVMIKSVCLMLGILLADDVRGTMLPC